MTYLPDTSATCTTFAVKHLGKTVKGSGVFKSEVFTDEILRLLDEKVIKPMFELPKVVQDEAELEEALGLTDATEVAEAAEPNETLN